MVDTYEYEEGTLNEIWENFQIKEDEQNDRLVVQRQDSARTEIASFSSDGTLDAPLSVSSINSIEYIDEANDLPDASSGERQLEDNTAYYFTSFVSDTASLRLGTVSPIIGAHGGIGGYIHTGAGDAIVGTNKGVFMRNVYVHAPGGTIFNVSGDTTTEVLIESCAFSDAAGIANIASLGTFDGFRVPSFKGCSFEDFDDGLTFTGTSDKVFFSECPIGRNITASGVTLLHFDANCTTDIVDITDSYIKGVQSDTVVVDVDPSATIGEIFQYRGVTHDASVAKDNILTGQAGFDQVGYIVQGSYPLEDSRVAGELDVDASGTVTITTQDTYETIDLASSLGAESERVSQNGNGVVTYEGKRDATVYITANVTVDTGNNVTIAISKNGTPQTASEMSITGTNSTNTFVSCGGIENLSTGDTIETVIKNNDTTDNIPVNSYTMSFIN